MLKSLFKKKTNSSLAMSSQITLITLVIALFALIITPDYFTSPLASCKTLIFYLTSLLTFFYLFLIACRRSHLYLSFSPLFTSLLTFLLFIFLTTSIKNFFYPEKAFLGFSGQLIAFALISLCASFLIKTKKSHLLTQFLLYLASFTTFISIAIFVLKNNNHFNSSFFSFFADPTFNFNLLFLGLATIMAYFFKKNKIKFSHLPFLLIIITGIILNIFIYFSFNIVQYPNFSTSAKVALQQTLFSKPLTWKHLLFGTQFQQYADAYYNQYFFQDGSILYQQSLSTPFTILTFFGWFGLFAWLALVFKTFTLCFDKKENNRHLYFILLISFIVQIFTPMHLVVLLIQALIIAFAVDKNKKTLINFQLATIFDYSEKKSYSAQDKSKTFIYLILCLAGFSLIFASLKIGRSYLGFYYHQQALKPDNDLNQFYHYSRNAVEVAPFIDVFNRYMALANLELMLEELERHVDLDSQKKALQYFNEAISCGQNAIAIDSNSAENHFFLGSLYKEVLPYFITQNHDQAIAQISLSYARALLLQPKNLNLCLILGNLYHEQGNLTDAKEVYMTAHKLNPNHPLINYQLGVLYAQQGESANAKMHFHLALDKLDPQDTKYSDNYELIMKNLSRLP